MDYRKRLDLLKKEYSDVVNRKNEGVEESNGVFNRYKYPVLTRRHVPISWKYDLNEKDNPYLMERMGINAVFNSGAIFYDGKYILAARVEGSDRKSFFAIAESASGTENFVFRDYPVLMPVLDEFETNHYDIRLTQHEDGWIYGLFCVESKDPEAPLGDVSSAVAKCGIARTKDLINWERLENLDSPSQQRNVLLHPEFVKGKYALYTRPSDGFVDVGKAGGIGFALVDDITKAKTTEEKIIDPRVYHTIKEAKNGAGAVPIKTSAGWLHIAHGVRNTAAGLRYVLYCFMTDLNAPDKVIYSPGGYFMAPQEEERVGDVSNVLFCNGAILDDKGQLFIYYASSDTRLHVAATTVEKMVDYCVNTPADGLTTYESVKQRIALINKNLK